MNESFLNTILNWLTLSQRTFTASMNSKRKKSSESREVKEDAIREMPQLDWLDNLRWQKVDLIKPMLSMWNYSISLNVSIVWRVEKTQQICVLHIRISDHQDQRVMTFGPKQTTISTSSLRSILYAQSSIYLSWFNESSWSSKHVHTYEQNTFVIQMSYHAWRANEEMIAVSLLSIQSDILVSAMLHTHSHRFSSCHASWFC